jgi:hypothetical protein
MSKKSMGGHQSAAIRTDEWLTPPEIFRVLPEFDLDPCAPVKRPWSTAKTHYTIEDNGLILPWYGRVWLNPPYGNAMTPWLHKIADHKDGIALIFARTDRNDFHKYVFGAAHSILWIKQRLSFYTTAGTKAQSDGGAPSVLIAYGERNSEALADSGIRGAHTPINYTPLIVIAISPSWKKVVGIALNRLSGQASTQQVYDLVERLAPDKIEKNEHYKAKIRQVLQENFTRIRKGYYVSFSTTIE